MTDDGLKPWRQALEVRFNDIDGMGHVNNALYHTYIEQARCRYLNELGIWHGTTQPGEFPIILARTEMDFVSPANWGPPLEIMAWMETVGRSSFTMGYAVKQVGRLTATARAVLVWYDYASGKPEPLPSDVATRLEGLVVDRASLVPSRR